MTRPATPPILSELRNSSSPATQVAALRALKNEIIGHELKKEQWIGLGVLAPITRILNSYRISGKRKHRDLTNGGATQSRRRTRTDEEEARLQAIIIVGSLAHGGPAYVAPLNASLVVAPLLSFLSPTDYPPQTTLAALRTLNAVADSLSLEHPTTDLSDDGLPGLLYTEQHLNSVAQILEQTSLSLIVQQQISLAATLLIKTCREDHHRILLARVGVLEALATKLASFVITTGCSLILKDGIVPNPGHIENIPPATARSRLAPILEAVGVIIQNSKTRTIQFLDAPAFTKVFPKDERDVSSNHDRKPTWGSERPSAFVTRQTSSNPIENLLPVVPLTPYHSSPVTQTAHFPPLGSIVPKAHTAQSMKSFGLPLEGNSNQGSSLNENEESPLIAWLIYVVRAEVGSTRLMAAWVLTILYRSGFADRRRETGFALLLVPLLVRMLDKDEKILEESSRAYDASFVLSSTPLIIKEKVPGILAMLIIDSIELQRAAVDAGVVKKLSQLLKESFDPLPRSSSMSLWTPQPLSSDSMDTREPGSASRLGLSGLSPSANHVTKMREAVLIALASVAGLKDEYRKAVIDSGVVPFVIESLKPYSMTSPSVAARKPYNDESPKQNTGLTGNPTSVVLAACGAARGLSRSVSTLRTSLIDASLAAPLFVLIKHPDLEIQVASTKVVCNLITEFSPMREDFIEAGISKILCEHAHSMNASLRLESVWALKHLVHTAPNSLKMTCLEELGPGWLKQIICNDTEDLSLFPGYRGDRDMGMGTPITMGTPNAAGEQVDLLNAVEERSRESSQVVEDDEEDEVRMVDSIGALSRPESNHRQPVLFRRPSSQGTTKESEFSLTNRMRTDDLAVQEQGLNLIRNLICGTGAPEMIDYLFRELGQDKVFDMLAIKLQPKATHSFIREKRSPENGIRQVPPPTEIIIAVIYIIVHIAAGLPRHRQLLISQSELLKLLVPLFGHAHTEIRVCCAWLVINLTWVDDQSDQMNCRSRAHELVKLGIYAKLEVLENDNDLDVRERTKTAIHQLSNLVR